MRNWFISSPLRLPLSHSPSPPHRITISETLMKETIDTVEPVIRKWDFEASTSYETIPYLFRDNRKEGMEFLHHVNALQHAMQHLIINNSSSELLVRVRNLMHVAMKRLQKEFYTFISGNGCFVDRGNVSMISSSVSGDVVADLKAIAECMIGAGYGEECAKIYTVIRKSFVEEALYYLGVENLNASQIQKMEWQLLEKRVKNWISAIKVAVKDVFLEERILCNEVFSASDHIKESCFAEISKDGAVSLLQFAGAIAKYKKLSAEKTFRFLDIYEAISELWPEIESIFDFSSTAAVKSLTVKSRLKIGDAVRTMLAEFEVAVLKDTSKPPPGGAVHPMTRYVMNYLVFLADYSGEVTEIIADWPLSMQSPVPEAYFSPHRPGGDYSGDMAVSERFAWLVLLLLCKLDSKAKMYRDAPLSYLFLANNHNYVVSKVRQSNLNIILGSDWVERQEEKVKQYTTNYKRMELRTS